MATKEQFEYFKYFFDSESRRYSELVNRSKIYISINSFLIGLLITNYGEVKALLVNTNIAIVYFSSLVLLLIAFLFNLLALSLFKYERPSDLNAIINSFGNTPSSNEDFFDERIVDFTVAQKRNSKVNTRRAIYLFISLTLIFIALCLSTGLLLISEI